MEVAMIQIRNGLASILLVALTTWPVLGQHYFLISFDANNDGGREVASYLESLQNSAELRLNGRLKLIQSTTRLPDEDLAKLRVAAKGAVARFVEKEKVAKDALLKSHRQRLGIKVDDDVVEDREKKDEKKVKANVIVQRLGAPQTTVAIQTILSDEVEESPVWKNTLKEVLSEEQLQTYRVELARQEASHRAAAIDAFMAKIDMALMLTDDQKPRIREIVDEGFGNVLLKNLRISNPRGVIRAQTPPAFSSIVDHILTPEQLAEWNLSIDPELQQINQGR
jgi:hypothetical protein